MFENWAPWWDVLFVLGFTAVVVALSVLFIPSPSNDELDDGGER